MRELAFPMYGHTVTVVSNKPFKKEATYFNGWQFTSYYNDGIIAIDACTAYTHKVNVVVLEDEFIADWEATREKSENKTEKK